MDTDALTRALAQEKDAAVRAVMEQARAAARLADPTTSEPDKLAAIATIRVDTTQGYAGSCLNGGYTPTWTLNTPSRPLRVDCYPQSSSATQRRVVLSVCPTSVSAPCPDASSILRVAVTFSDDGSFGRAVGVQTWSNQ